MTRLSINRLSLLILLIFFQSCGVFFTPPAGVESNSVIGEITATEKDFKKLPAPQEPIIVGVYKFRDQTGQYKASNMGARSEARRVGNVINTLATASQYII